MIITTPSFRYWMMTMFLLLHCNFHLYPSEQLPLLSMFFYFLTKPSQQLELPSSWALIPISHPILEKYEFMPLKTLFGTNNPTIDH